MIDGCVGGWCSVGEILQFFVVECETYSSQPSTDGSALTGRSVTSLLFVVPRQCCRTPGGILTRSGHFDDRL